MVDGVEEPTDVGIAGAIGLIQLAFALWSIVANWDDSYVYAVRAVQASSHLFKSWDQLARMPPLDLAQHVKNLDEETQRQECSDLEQNITDQEKRFGMRAALYYYQLPCEACHAKPPSMKPSNCDTCGNF